MLELSDRAKATITTLGILANFFSLGPLSIEFKNIQNPDEFQVFWVSTFSRFSEAFGRFH